MSQRAPGENGRLRAAFFWLESPQATRVMGIVGSVSGFLAVAGGAIASHALRGRLPAERMQIVQTALDYQFYHALALLALVALLRHGTESPCFARAGGCFVAGTLLFCGSLWAVALSGAHASGLLAPAGGVLLMCGWLLTAVGMVKNGH